MRILHTADWHIGLVSWKGTKPTERNEEIRSVLEEMVEKAKGLKIDLVLVAGDLLDNYRSPDLESMRILIKTLEGLAEIAPVVVVLGNHDWRGIGSVADLMKNVHFLGIEGPIKCKTLRTPAGTVSILPIPYLRGSKDLLERAGYTQKNLWKIIQMCDSKPFEEDYRILLGHLAYRSPRIRIWSEEIGEPVSIEDSVISGTRFSYVALGHYHEFSVLLDHPLTVYSGSIVQTSFSDLSDKGFVVVDVDEGKLEFVRVRHKKLDVVDGRRMREREIIEAVNESDADYVKVILGKENGYLADRILEIGKVRSVEVRIETNRERKSAVIDASKPIADVLTDYLRDSLGLSDEEIERALEIFKEALRRTTA